MRLSSDVITSFETHKAEVTVYARPHWIGIAVVATMTVLAFLPTVHGSLISTTTGCCCTTRICVCPPATRCRGYGRRLFSVTISRSPGCRCGSMTQPPAWRRLRITSTASHGTRRPPCWYTSCSSTCSHTRKRAALPIARVCNLLRRLARCSGRFIRCASSRSRGSPSAATRSASFFCCWRFWRTFQRGGRRLGASPVASPQGCLLRVSSPLAAGEGLGMTFFVTLIALDVFPLRRLPLAVDAFTDRRYRQIWREKIPFVLIGVAGGATAWLAQRAQPDTMATTAEWNWIDRLLQSTYGLCFYVAKTVWPAGLAAVYQRPDHLPRGGASIFFVCLIVVTASAALLTWDRPQTTGPFRRCGCVCRDRRARPRI